MLTTASHPTSGVTHPREEPVEVSVVMPRLNKARTVGVGKAVRALESLGVRGEVIVADNGSTDGSQDIAAMAGARVVWVTARGLWGGAPGGGIAAARGRYIIIGDADDSYDFGRRGSSSGCGRRTTWSWGIVSGVGSYRGPCRGTTGTSATRS